jgi:hypothetical protein
VSVRLISRVFKLHIPTTDKFVLIAMADHAHDDGTHVFPSIKLLADKTSLSERAVQKALRRLKASHFIKKVKKESYQRACEYVLILDKGEPYSPITGGKKGERRSLKGERGGADRVNVGAEMGEPRSPEPLGTSPCRGGGESLDSSESVEGEGGKQKQKRSNGNVSAAAAAAAIASAFKAFKSVGISRPFGTREFQAAWLKIWTAMVKGDSFTDAMEMQAQHCEESGIPVPGTWFKLKRKVEEIELASST